MNLFWEKREKRRTKTEPRRTPALEVQVEEAHRGESDSVVGVKNWSEWWVRLSWGGCSTALRVQEHGTDPLGLPLEANRYERIGRKW